MVKNMYNLLGVEENLRNISKISYDFLDQNQPKNFLTLRNSYLNFLRSHQPHLAVNDDVSNIFIEDQKIEDNLKVAYQRSSLNDLDQNDVLGESYDTEARKRYIDLVKKAHAVLSNVNAEICELFDLVIHSIFFKKSKSTLKGVKGSFGGSSSTAIGVIWISGYGNVIVSDIVEFLIHELTHHLLFIDERCNAQFYYDQMILPKNYAQSAILSKKRPLDKVVHSIIVSTEILLSRQRFLDVKGITIHPQTEILKRNTLAAIDDVLNLQEIDKVITNRTKFLLNQCSKILN